MLRYCVGLNVLHTSPGCTLAGNQGATRMTGNVYSYNCDDLATTGPYGTTQSTSQGKLFPRNPLKKKKKGKKRDKNG